jgi:hypothetical protein
LKSPGLDHNVINDWREVKEAVAQEAKIIRDITVELLGLKENVRLGLFGRGGRLNPRAVSPHRDAATDEDARDGPGKLPPPTPKFPPTQKKAFHPGKASLLFFIYSVPSYISISATNYSGCRPYQASRQPSFKCGRWR